MNARVAENNRSRAAIGVPNAALYYDSAGAFRDQAVSPLFSPISLGRIEAKNRVMRVATTCNLAVGSRVSDRQLAFYQAIARGGTGSIVTENMRITSVGAAPNVLVASDRDAIPGFQKLAQVMHAEGALLIGQINHGGRQHLTRRVPPLLVAPSALACPRSGGVPHELSADEISGLVEGFVRSAVNCIEAGFDGVEIIAPKAI